MVEGREKNLIVCVTKWQLTGVAYANLWYLHPRFPGMDQSNSVNSWESAEISSENVGICIKKTCDG